MSDDDETFLRTSRLQCNLEIDSQDVTVFEDVRDYYKHQAKLFSGDRKRLASTEDLDMDTSPIITKSENLQEKTSEGDNVRPDKLMIHKSTSPEEKGVKDSKRPEDWERKEARKVERLHGGGGKVKAEDGEDTKHVTSVAFKDDTGSVVVESAYDVKRGNNTQRYHIGSVKVVGDKPTETKHISFVGTKVESKSPIARKRIDGVAHDFTTRGTSPLDGKEIYSRELSTEDGEKNIPTLELIIGRKEVHTKDASATAESRLTLYGTKDVEISIHSQSHISVTTTRKDNFGTETSETVDVGVTTTAGTGDVHAPETQLKQTDYIIPPTNLTDINVVEVTQRKREETVNFSGTKHIYRYESSEKPDANIDSPIEDSNSHHVTDTGISLTRGTTDTITSSLRHPPGVTQGMQTTGFVSDTLDDAEQEDGELTDAGLSPIQADDHLPIMDEEAQYTETATSPIEFVEGHVDTSEAATLTDQIDTKDASNSPIKTEDDGIEHVLGEHIPSDDEILLKRRYSGDVKSKIKFLEEQVAKTPTHVEYFKRKRELIDSEDEFSSLKEEEVMKGSTDTLAQVEDTFEHVEVSAITEKPVIPDTTDDKQSFPPEPTKSKDTVVTSASKHVGPKIAELQKIFSKSTELDDSDDESKKGSLRYSIVSDNEQRKLDGTVETDQVDDVVVEIEAEYKTVKEATQIFEELISKSTETTPKKKSALQHLVVDKPVIATTEEVIHLIPSAREKKPTTEVVYTEDDIQCRMSAIEDQIEIDGIITEDNKLVTQLLNNIDLGELQTKPGEPCREPICEKVILTHVSPPPSLKESFQNRYEDAATISSDNEFLARTETERTSLEIIDLAKQQIDEITKEIIHEKRIIEEKFVKEEVTPPVVSKVSTLRKMFEKPLEMDQIPVSDSSSDIKQKDVQDKRDIIEKALISNAELISAIALPIQSEDGVKPLDIDSEDVKQLYDEVVQTEITPLNELTDVTDISVDRTADDLSEDLEKRTVDSDIKMKESKKEHLSLKEVISSSDVRKVISEVLEATRLIRADVREIKPDLTPTPEGQLITMLPSVSFEHLTDLEMITEDKEIVSDIQRKVDDIEKLKASVTMDGDTVFQPKLISKTPSERLETKMENITKSPIQLQEKIIRTLEPTFEVAESEKDMHKTVKDYKQAINEIAKEETEKRTIAEHKYKTEKLKVTDIKTDRATKQLSAKKLIDEYERLSRITDRREFRNRGNKLVNESEERSQDVLDKKLKQIKPAYDDVTQTLKLLKESTTVKEEWEVEMQEKSEEQKHDVLRQVLPISKEEEVKSMEKVSTKLVTTSLEIAEETVKREKIEIVAQVIKVPKSKIPKEEELKHEETDEICQLSPTSKEEILVPPEKESSELETSPLKISDETVKKKEVETISKVVKPSKREISKVKEHEHSRQISLDYKEKELEFPEKGNKKLITTPHEFMEGVVKKIEVEIVPKVVESLKQEISIADEPDHSRQISLVSKEEVESPEKDSKKLIKTPFEITEEVVKKEEVEIISTAVKPSKQKITEAEEPRIEDPAVWHASKRDAVEFPLKGSKVLATKQSEIAEAVFMMKMLDIVLPAVKLSKREVSKTDELDYPHQISLVSKAEVEHPEKDSKILVKTTRQIAKEDVAQKDVEIVSTKVKLSKQEVLYPQEPRSEEQDQPRQMSFVSKEDQVESPQKDITQLATYVPEISKEVAKKEKFEIMSRLVTTLEEELFKAEETKTQKPEELRLVSLVPKEERVESTDKVIRELVTTVPEITEEVVTKKDIEIVSKVETHSKEEIKSIEPCQSSQVSIVPEEEEVEFLQKGIRELVTTADDILEEVGKKRVVETVSRLLITPKWEISKAEEPKTQEPDELHHVSSVPEQEEIQFLKKGTRELVTVVTEISKEDLEKKVTEIVSKFPLPSEEDISKAEESKTEEHEGTRQVSIAPKGEEDVSPKKDIRELVTTGPEISEEFIKKEKVEIGSKVVITSRKEISKKEEPKTQEFDESCQVSTVLKDREVGSPEKEIRRLVTITSDISQEVVKMGKVEIVSEDLKSTKQELFEAVDIRRQEPEELLQVLIAPREGKVESTKKEIKELVVIAPDISEEVIKKEEVEIVYKFATISKEEISEAEEHKTKESDEISQMWLATGEEEVEPLQKEIKKLVITAPTILEESVKKYKVEIVEKGVTLSKQEISKEGEPKTKEPEEPRQESLATKEEEVEFPKKEISEIITATAETSQEVVKKEEIEVVAKAVTPSKEGISEAEVPKTKEPEEPPQVTLAPKEEEMESPKKVISELITTTGDISQEVVKKEEIEVLAKVVTPTKVEISETDEPKTKDPEEPCHVTLAPKEEDMEFPTKAIVELRTTAADISQDVAKKEKIEIVAKPVTPYKEKISEAEEPKTKKPEEPRQVTLAPKGVEIESLKKECNELITTAAYISHEFIKKEEIEVMAISVTSTSEEISETEEPKTKDPEEPCQETFDPKEDEFESPIKEESKAQEPDEPRQESVVLKKKEMLYAKRLMRDLVTTAHEVSENVVKKEEFDIVTKLVTLVREDISKAETPTTKELYQVCLVPKEVQVKSPTTEIRELGATAPEISEEVVMNRNLEIVSEVVRPTKQEIFEAVDTKIQEPEQARQVSITLKEGEVVPPQEEIRGIITIAAEISEDFVTKEKIERLSKVLETTTENIYGTVELRTSQPVKSRQVSLVPKVKEIESSEKEISELVITTPDISEKVVMEEEVEIVSKVLLSSKREIFKVEEPGTEEHVEPRLVSLVPKIEELESPKKEISELITTHAVISGEVVKEEVEILSKDESPSKREISKAEEPKRQESEESRQVSIVPEKEDVESFQKDIRVLATTALEIAEDVVSKEESHHVSPATNEQDIAFHEIESKGVGITEDEIKERVCKIEVADFVTEEVKISELEIVIAEEPKPKITEKTPVSSVLEEEEITSEEENKNILMTKTEFMKKFGKRDVMVKDIISRIPEITEAEAESFKQIEDHQILLVYENMTEIMPEEKSMDVVPFDYDCFKGDEIVIEEAKSLESDVDGLSLGSVKIEEWRDKLINIEEGLDISMEKSVKIISTVDEIEEKTIDIVDVNFGENLLKPIIPDNVYVDESILVEIGEPRDISLLLKDEDVSVVSRCKEITSVADGIIVKKIKEDIDSTKSVEVDYENLDHSDNWPMDEHFVYDLDTGRKSGVEDYGKSDTEEKISHRSDHLEECLTSDEFSQLSSMHRSDSTKFSETDAEPVSSETESSYKLEIHTMSEKSDGSIKQSIPVVFYEVESPHTDLTEASESHGESIIESSRFDSQTKLIQYNKNDYVLDSNDIQLRDDILEVTVHHDDTYYISKESYLVEDPNEQISVQKRHGLSKITKFTSGDSKSKHDMPESEKHHKVVTQIKTEKKLKQITGKQVSGINRVITSPIITKVGEKSTSDLKVISKVSPRKVSKLESRKDTALKTKTTISPHLEKLKIESDVEASSDDEKHVTSKAPSEKTPKKIITSKYETKKSSLIPVLPQKRGMKASSSDSASTDSLLTKRREIRRKPKTSTIHKDPYKPPHSVHKYETRIHGYMQSTVSRNMKIEGNIHAKRLTEAHIATKFKDGTYKFDLKEREKCLPPESSLASTAETRKRYEKSTVQLPSLSKFIGTRQESRKITETKQTETYSSLKRATYTEKKSKSKESISVKKFSDITINTKGYNSSKYTENVRTRDTVSRKSSAVRSTKKVTRETSSGSMGYKSGTVKSISHVDSPKPSPSPTKLKRAIPVEDHVKKLFVSKQSIQKQPDSTICDQLLEIDRSRSACPQQSLERTPSSTSLPGSPIRVRSANGGTKVLTSEVFTRSHDHAGSIEVIYKQPYDNLRKVASGLRETEVSLIDTTDSSLSESIALPSSPSDHDISSEANGKHKQPSPSSPKRRSLESIYENKHRMSDLLICGLIPEDHGAEYVDDVHEVIVEEKEEAYTDLPRKLLLAQIKSAEDSSLDVDDTHQLTPSGTGITISVLPKSTDASIHSMAYTVSTEVLASEIAM